VTGKLATNPQGDPEKGKEAFETRGCMACHSMGEAIQKRGRNVRATSAASAEKNIYDYLVRWIHNPRERTLPYCPFEKRDLTEEDYKKKGVPFVFDFDHSKCPNDGHELLVQQMTPMPNLRLGMGEVRDIASYLMTRKQSGASYPAADYLEDPKLKAKGQFLVKNYGCAGCHEIAGLEEEQRIGTELTKGRLEAARAPRFRVEGARSPARWLVHAQGLLRAQAAESRRVRRGQGKAQARPLKMPNFNLSKPDIDAVTTSCWGRWIPIFRRSINTCRPISGRTSSKAGGLCASTIAWAAIRCTSGRRP
jgi:cytochrome c2